MRIIDRNRPGWLPIWANFFGTEWRVGGEDFIWRGEQFGSLTVSLNTALAVGNDAIRFAARMHGQCEIHAWVDGPNRSWLADIISQALNDEVLRREMGWESVINLLRSRNDEPIVTSYSVTGGFPDRDLAKWDRPAMPDGWLCPGWDKDEWQQMDEDEQVEYFDAEVVEEAWAALSEDERWAAGMAGLREDPGLLELRPEDWTDYHFGNGLTVFDLNAPDWERKLDEALGLTAAN